MPWALGVSIANLFQRIADLLNQGIQTGGSGGSGGGSGPGAPDPLHPPPPTQPPTQSPPQTTPPPSVGVIPHAVTLPAQNLFPVTAPGPAECPVFTPEDYRRLVALEGSGSQSGGPIIQGPGEQGGFETDMPIVIGTGQPLEFDDIFRFRAFGTAGSVPVSFYGRIQRPDGAIQPFNFVLTPDNAGNIVQTLPQAGPGYLLGVAASVPVNSISSGTVSAVGEVGRVEGGSFVPHTLLFSGALDDLTPLTTGSVPTGTTSQASTFQQFEDLNTNTIPHFVTITPIAGTQMRFTRISFDWRSSASAGTRLPALAAVVGGKSIFSVNFLLTRTANQGGSYIASLGGVNGTALTLTYERLPSNMWFTDPVDMYIFDSGTVAVNDTEITVRIDTEHAPL